METVFNPQTGIYEQVIPAMAPAGNKAIKNTLKNPVQQPKLIRLSASVPALGAAGFLRWVDTLGMSDFLGLTTGPTTYDLVPDSSTADGLKKYLQSYALIVNGYNMTSGNANEMSKNLQMFNNAVDGEGTTEKLFQSLTQSMFANDPNLLNICNSFVWTMETAFKFINAANASATDAVDYSFVFNVIAAVPYSDLDAYLEANRIPKQQRTVGLNC